ASILSSFGFGVRVVVELAQEIIERHRPSTISALTDPALSRSTPSGGVGAGEGGTGVGLSTGCHGAGDGDALPLAPDGETKGRTREGEQGGECRGNVDHITAHLPWACAWTGACPRWR